MTTAPAGAPPEQLFLDHLPVVERIVAVIARRHALHETDRDEFAAWARARLIDNNYAIIRKFGGRSSLKTFLTVVVSNLYRDYRHLTWGRWRPSAAAIRLGPIGVRLEELLYRDGCTLREALAILRSRGADASDRELVRLAGLLPRRVDDREVGLERVRETEATPVNSAITTAEREAVDRGLGNAIRRLPAEDQVITRMRYWDGMTVADISRALHLEQKRLYRRLEQIQRSLRAHLANEGVTDTVARDVLREEGLW